MVGKDKQLMFVLVFITVLSCFIFVYFLYTKGIHVGKLTFFSKSKDTLITNIPPAPTQLRLTSEAFINNSTIPTRFTCKGGNSNPPLTISGVKAGTKSLVIILEDPDALLKSFDHWVVFNIDPALSIVNEDFREGTTGQNSYGKPGYAGPCPSSGTHRYVFKLYALDTFLDLQAGATKTEVLIKAKGHILDFTELVGLYN